MANPRHVQHAEGQWPSTSIRLWWLKNVTYGSDRQLRTAFWMLRLACNSLPEITVLEFYLPSSDGHLCSRKKTAQFPPTGRGKTALHHLTWSHFQNCYRTCQFYRNAGDTVNSPKPMTKCDQCLWKWITKYWWDCKTVDWHVLILILWRRQNVGHPCPD